MGAAPDVIARPPHALPLSVLRPPCAIIVYVVMSTMPTERLGSPFFHLAVSFMIDALGMVE